jgi:DNA-binding sugar fermentation-stimulating protein
VRYEKTEKAAFLGRPIRFMTVISLDGRGIVCHVENSGWCRGLLNL